MRFLGLGLGFGLGPAPVAGRRAAPQSPEPSEDSVSFEVMWSPTAKAA